jgi:resorcinol 4-hydroxylase (FADH2)
MNAGQRWWHTVIDSIGRDWKYAYAKPEYHKARCNYGRGPALKEGSAVPATLQGCISAARVDPSVDMLRAAVKSVLPDIKSRALACERARTVPVESVEALRQAGFYKLVQPTAYGGYEQDFTVLVALMMEMAAACASTAWVCGLLAAHQWMVGLFPAQAQDDAWGTSPGATFCGSYAPINEARPDRDGYRLNGRWSFASGCDNSQWAICAARLPGTSERPGQPAFLLVPASDYAIEDTWEVIGLAGTGSRTLVLNDVLVPKHRMLLFADAASGRSPGSKHYANPLYAVPVYCHVSACLAATAVGAASGAVDDFIAGTTGRLTRGSVTGGDNRMAEFSSVQIRVAEAAASVDAARMILLRDLEDIAREVRQSGEGSVRQRITNRRGQAFAVNLAVRSVDMLNAANGGNGLAVSNPIQRAWRDVNAVARHVSVNWDSVAAMYGQMALGLEPRGQY